LKTTALLNYVEKNVEQIFRLLEIRTSLPTTTLPPTPRRLGSHSSTLMSGHMKDGEREGVWIGGVAGPFLPSK